MAKTIVPTIDRMAHGHCVETGISTNDDAEPRRVSVFEEGVEGGDAWWEKNKARLTRPTRGARPTRPVPLTLVFCTGCGASRAGSILELEKWRLCATCKGEKRKGPRPVKYCRKCRTPIYRSTYNGCAKSWATVATCAAH